MKENLAGVHFQKTHWSSVTAEITLQTELAQRLMPVEKVLAEKTTPEEEPKNIGIEVASGIGTGLADAGKDFLTGIWDTVSDPLGAAQGIGQAVLHPVDTFTHLKTAITDSYERDVINGDANSRTHWFSYAIGTTVGTVVGTKGVGAVAKSGAVTKTLSATKNAVNKSTLQNFLPYAPQNQFAFAGNVPFNTFNGPVVKENLIVKAKVEFDGKGKGNPTHSSAQYQKLKEQLALDEIQSVVNTTKHGAERLIERGFTPKDISDLKLRPDIIKSQSDGAQVFIKQVNGKYNVIVEGDNGVITSLKNISEKSLNRLSDNYGWR